MARDIILNLAISLDGFICDEDGGFAWISGQGDVRADTADHFDFDGFLANLVGCAEVVYVRPPLEHRWGQRVVRLYAPDRHINEVGENMKSVCRRFRDQGMTPEQIAARMEVPLKFVTGCLR